LKFHPDFVAAQFDIERIESAGGWTGGITDASSDCEGAIMAGAMIEVALSLKIDVASGVGADGIEGLNLITGTAEVDRADGGLGELVPGVNPIGEDGEFAGYAVIGKRIECGDPNCGTGAGFSTEGIEKDLQADGDWDHAEHNANDGGEKALKETAPTDWRRSVTRIVHN
jgi:hypothetical protein